MVYDRFGNTGRAEVKLRLVLSILSVVVLIAAIIALIVVIVWHFGGEPYDRDDYDRDSCGRANYHHVPIDREPPEKRAGRQGEIAAANMIRSVLREGDRLLTNVFVSFEGKPAELDNVIINKYGVFIIEVKNYKGRLYGQEDDYEWKKYKDDSYGNTFERDVKNPIKQVRRQIYILAKHLRDYGADVWVEGYVFFVQGSSPVNIPCVLKNRAEIDRAIHTFGRNRLTGQQVEEIGNILS